MKRGGYIKRNVKPRARSKTKHKPSVLRPNKFIRATPKQWNEIRKAVCERAHEHCENPKCQRSTPLEIGAPHHIKFKSHGGGDFDPDGLIWLCRKCHGAKHGIKVIEH